MLPESRGSFPQPSQVLSMMFLADEYCWDKGLRG